MFFRKDDKIKDNNFLTKVCALLIHAAKIDENYTDKEKEIIKKALKELFNINSEKIDDFLKIAEKKEQESNQIIEFTKEIKKKPMDFRIKIIEILCKIVYSDGTNDSYESSLVRRVCGLLYISDKVSGDIKLKIKNR